jgi:signal transduction histidine kinase
VRAAIRPRPDAAGVEHPSLVPAQLLADLEGDAGSSVAGPGAAPPRRPVRRSVRDWVVDVAVFVLCLLAGAFAVGVALLETPPPPDPLIAADVVAGVLACLALWLRRRWPVGVAVALAVVSSFSDMAALAVLVSLFTVAVHRRWPTVVAVAGLNLVSLAVYLVVRPVAGMEWMAFGALGAALTAAVVAWGMFVRARRQLIRSLQDRALRAEAEQLLRVDQARQLERTRIAREMHDVLAHRISLLSMHAGALEFRPDAPAAEIARAAGVIRASARQALEDLREVIGVLRDSPDGVPSTRPQPTLGDLPALVEEVRGAGVRITEQYRVGDLGAAPVVAGRTAYRVVQEGLTNVRKHAPGAAASVAVSGGPEDGLTVEVGNPPPVGARLHAPLPSGGTGLVGLRERVTLAGGHLEHGWTPDGDFRLSAWLPWPAPA